MRLSIITINLNNAPGLRKTIESVVNQTSKEFEYIVIDGGSNDNSVNVISEYSDKITYWVSEHDEGIYTAMNKGLRIAKGDYCQFVNSGDWLIQSDVIETMLSTLSGSSFHYGNMLKILPGGKVFRDKCESGKISMFTFFKGSLNHTPTLIKRSLFEKYGYYDASLKIVSDWKFYLIAVGLNNESVSYIDLDVAMFDMNGISNSDKELVVKERNMVLKALLPDQILKDYLTYFESVLITERLKQNRCIWFIIRTLYRILSKADRCKM